MSEIVNLSLGELQAALRAGDLLRIFRILKEIILFMRAGGDDRVEAILSTNDEEIFPDEFFRDTIDLKVSGTADVDGLPIGQRGTGCANRGERTS